MRAITPTLELSLDRWRHYQVAVSLNIWCLNAMSNGYGVKARGQHCAWWWREIIKRGGSCP